jgi:hypothetical protein
VVTLRHAYHPGTNHRAWRPLRHASVSDPNHRARFPSKWSTVRAGILRIRRGDETRIMRVAFFRIFGI